MNMNVPQDWNHVVFRKNPRLKDSNAPKEVVAKTTTNKNTDKLGHSVSIRKLENDHQDEQDFHLPKVKPELRKQIITARTNSKLTQTQLAQKINEKPQVIQDYENGKAIPNSMILSKLSRVLGVQLKK